MDAVIQALSGLMLTSGASNDPPIRVGVPVADGIAPLYAVIGTLSALMARRATGRGQHVDISMLGVVTSFVAIEDWDAMERLGQQLRTGATVPRLAPFGVFTCRDGHVAVVAPQDAMAHKLFHAIGRDDLIEHPAYATRDGRVRHHVEVEALIEAWTKERPVTQVVDTLEAAGVSAAPVRTPSDAVRDPGVLARRETVPVVHPLLGEIPDLVTYGLPITFSENETGYRRAAPLHGGDTAEVLRTILDYPEERVAELRRQRVI
jgi:CoA:oxalate CoA-transferase